MRWAGAALALLVGTSLLHLAYVAYGPMSLAPDEAHYWEWSRRLDWSYYSKGPMVAWLIAASTRLFGDSELGVRAPAVALGLGTGLLGMRLALDQFASGRVAFLAALVAALLPLYSAGSMLMTIDAPFVFCWALAVYGLWRALTAPADRARRWWMLVGLAVGLGMLGKYTMALFVPTAVIATWASRKDRVDLRLADVAIAAAIALACSAPIVIWNLQHDWVSLRHVLAQAGLGGEHPGPRLGNVAELVGSQLGVVSPGILAAMALTTARFFGKRITTDREAHAFLLGTSLPVIAFFFLWSFYSKVEANWAAPAWLTLTIALAADWDERLRRDAEKAARFAAWIALALVPGILLVLVAHFPQALGLVGIRLPARLDPTSRLRGWRELGTTVGAIETSSGAPLPLAAASYQMTSELAFYVPGHPTVRNLDLGNRRRNQYDVWGGAETLVGRDIVFVIEGDIETLPPGMCAGFERAAVVTLAAPVSPDDPGRKASIFRCSGYRGTVAARSPARY